MTWFRVGAGGELEEVSSEQITRELREADHAAGPKEGSRDWRPCPKCKTGLRAFDRVPTPRDREFWECPGCGMSISYVRQIPAAGELSPYEWSLVRHLSCGVFGHRSCLPDVWLDDLRLEGDRIVSGAGLGEFDLARVRR